jgi:hypothetical protein
VSGFEREQALAASRPPQDDKLKSNVTNRTRPFVRWRWPLLALFLALFFSLGRFAGAVQNEQEILRAKSIIAEAYELQGADGKKYASLAKEATGEVRLKFFDQAGRSRLQRVNRESDC